MHDLSLAVAKQRLRITDVWQLCGLPGEPSKSCCCPFHDDHSASFSTWSEGRRWKCFAGCGGGDAVDFLQRARGLSPGDACREFLRLADARLASAPPKNRKPIQAGRSARKIQLQDTTSGEENHWRALATLRNVSVEAVSLAVERGLIRFGIHKGHPAWFVTDESRRNAQARRMDGRTWPEIGSKKAWTLRGSQAAWPVGTQESTPYPSIALCEGGPDLIAAFHFIECEERKANCTTVAMLGAGLAIHADALSLFAGKRIRIFGHADASGAGDEAVERWADQLTRAGADVDAFNFAGLRKVDCSHIKDLNDLTSIHADDFEAHRELWSLMP